MPDDDLDAHSLRVVKAISDTGSITAAARLLGYSQPAVSQQCAAWTPARACPSSSASAAACA